MAKKTKYSYLKNILSLLTYNILSKEKRDKLKNERLKNLLEYSKENSEYFKELYKDIDISNISINNLNELPPTNKITLQENFDLTLTDKNLKKDEIEKFISNPENLNKKYLNEYIFLQTSGTTGSPITTIYGKDEIIGLFCVGLTRTYYNLLDVMKFTLKGQFKNCISSCILPTKTPCITTFLAKFTSKMPVNININKTNKIKIHDIEEPISEIVSKLNKEQPFVLASFVSYIELLCDEADKGNLKINPLYITTVGEKLTKEKQERIEKTFKGISITNYACTEAGEIAHRCKEGHFHLNDDWIIVECVDENYNLIKDESLSDKILITNLWNYTQPFIRYEINDRCIMHHEKCSCGNKSPWIEVEGRVFSPIEFKGIKDDIIKISPISLELLIHKVDEGIRRYQIEVYDKNINLRIIEKENYDKKEIFENIKEVLEDYLFENNIRKYNINLLDENPIIDKSGKFRQIYQIK